MTDRNLRTERLPIIADHLAEAMNEFKAWDLQIAPSSRIPKSELLLREIAERGQYPSDVTELSLVAEAIRTAQEFVEIANGLPAQPVESLKLDLRTAVRGDLVGISNVTGSHLQFQSQLWVGSMMAQAEARVGVISRPGHHTSPDFILENGSLLYGVEVKRPNGVLDAQNIVRKAAKQIRGDSYHGGMIVVDLTDCIDMSLRFSASTGTANTQAIDAKLSELAQLLHKEIFQERDERLKVRREHVFGLYTFCRFTHWDLADLSYPYLIRPVAVVLYWRRNALTLRAHRARWLTNLIGGGIGASGHEEMGSRTLPWSPPPP